MKQHVLHLIGSNCVGGPEKQILHHAVDMQGSDYEIEIGSFHDQPGPPEILQAAAQRDLSTVCLSGGLRPGLVKELSRVLKQRKGYLLCTHGFKANVVGYLAARRTNTPHVAFLRGWTAETMRVILYEIIERRVLSRASTVVCVSRRQAEQVAPLRGKRSKPIVVPNAMIPPFSRAQDGPRISKEALNIPEDAVVFGSIGRLSAEKGHRYLISAFHQLCASTHDARPLFLVVVGDGREQEALEKQAADLQIRDRIHFAGFQGNPADWMRLFDCMVQPSLTEGTPNSVLEALCFQIPVVATAVGGVPDLIVNDSNGLLVPAKDEHALAESMKKIADSPDLRARLAGGANDIKSEYSPGAQRKKLMEVYEIAFRGSNQNQESKMERETLDEVKLSS